MSDLRGSLLGDVIALTLRFLFTHVERKCTVQSGCSLRFCGRRSFDSVIDIAACCIDLIPVRGCVCRIVRLVRGTR
jgi:hypothetical protein